MLPINQSLCVILVWKKTLDEYLASTAENNCKIGQLIGLNNKWLENERSRFPFIVSTAAIS